MFTRDQIAQWISNRLDEMGPGEIFPTDRQLAILWGCTPRTVRRILAPYKKRGDLIGIPGKGTFKPTPEAETETKPLRASRSSHLELAYTLSRSIAKGQLKRGQPLPPAKYVRIQYKVSDQTVTKAYRHLADRGLVEKIGRNYWVGGFAPWMPALITREAWLIGPSIEGLQKEFSSGRLRLAYRRCEYELRSCGLQLKCADWDTFIKLRDQWLQSGYRPAGIIFHAHLLEQYPGWVRKAVMPLISRGDPMKIVFDMNTYNQDLRTVPKAEIISRGNFNTAQARTVAHFCAQLPYESTIIVSQAPEDLKIRRHFARFIKVIDEILRQEDFTGMLRMAFLTDMPEVTPEWIMAECLDSDKDYLTYLTQKYGKKSTEIFRRMLIVRKNPEELVRDQAGSALYITASDDLSRSLLTQFANRELRHPEQAGVVTLQNEPSCTAEGITGCSPDWEQAGYLMAHAIVNDIDIERTSKGFIRVDSPLVKRTTTV